jgi:hypothetical protein
MSTVTEAFRRAGVPKSCWAIKAEATGRGAVNIWAKNLKERMDSREALLSAYVVVPAQGGRNSEAFDKATETVELLARQAVVEGNPVKVVPFYQLVHNLEKGVDQVREDADPEATRRLTAFDLQGTGLIVVPYLPTPEESDCTTFQYRTVVDFLLSHIYEGGAVVIGGSQAVSKRLLSKYPNSLERMLVGNSEIFET